MLNLISLLGLFVMVGLAWSLSSNRRGVNWRLVVMGMALQLVVAAVLFNSQSWTFGDRFEGGILFWTIDRLFAAMLGWVAVGTEFVFGVHPQAVDPPLDPTADPRVLLTTFTLGVLPTVIFVSSLMAILYHLGVMQRVVFGMAWVMQRTLRTSGAESLAAAANVLMGQTEAPLVVRPYVPRMTRSELNALMVGGFSTITGALMAVFAGFGVNPGHLVTASIISAPAALVIAKIMQPETETPQTAGQLALQTEHTARNVIDAAAQGATEGMRLVINIVAMLIAFIALIAMVDWMLLGVGNLLEAAIRAIDPQSTVELNWSLSGLFGIVFFPLAFVMGVPLAECLIAGDLLGTKMIVNEFVAYLKLAPMLEANQAAAEAVPEVVEGAEEALGAVMADQRIVLSRRTEIIMIYALAGFSNLSSIAIQLGGIGVLAPERRGELAQLGLRAMFGGMLACCMTACIAGVLLDVVN